MVSSLSDSQEPPLNLDGAAVLFWHVLAEPIGVIVDPVSGRNEVDRLAIGKYPNGEVFYRFLCDRSWEVLEDIDFPTLEEALHSPLPKFTRTGLRQTFPPVPDSAPAISWEERTHQ